MLKKVLITTAIVLQGVSIAFAQTTPPAAPVANTHKSYDQKARDCKKQAKEQGLTGDERRSFVAKCMKA
jgi:ribosome assembly protein YihI (activator of Der GTPase)